MTNERVQKILAQAGYGSRRSCEELIKSGRVTVNGKVAIIGQKADVASDQIAVDGAPIPAAEKLVYIALNKPRNVISAVTSPDPRRTVRELVEVPERIFPVGRLDAESEGLILMTNDGELANQLTHPRYGHEKEYHVLIARRPDDKQLEAWRRGIILEDGYKTAPAQVYFMKTSGKGAWIRVIMKEGRKRQIRETGMRIGLPVVRILRVRIGQLELGHMKSGEWRYLSEEELELLRKTGKDRTKDRKKKPSGNPKAKSSKKS